LSKKISMVTPYIWPKKNIYLQIRVILCLFLLVIGRFINVSLPLYNKWIVNGLTHPDPSIYKLIIISFFLKFLQGSGAMGGFILSLRSLLWIPIQQYTTYEIQVELFEHLHSLSLRWHLSRKTGQVIRIMDRGTSSIDSILNYTLFSVLPTFADILIAIIFFFTTFSVYFGLLIFVTMILYLVITIFISEWRTKFRRDMNEKENFSHAVGVDSLLNYETVKYCNAEQAECDRFSHSIKNFQNIEWKTSASLSLLNFCQNSVIGIGLIIGSILIAYFILNDGSTLTAGDYVLFTTYMLQLYVPLNFFGTIYRLVLICSG
uniref:ABC transmembrane type-1 domain-containing protein n=1 Tax=Dracunculus medinensis TaxID=318479 RepID=A0A0N4UKF8_DRAME